MPTARALCSPPGEAVKDNVEEREKFWVGQNYGLRITDGDGQTDVEFETVLSMVFVCNEQTEIDSYGIIFQFQIKIQL